jgi:hypothetical protein
MLWARQGYEDYSLQRVTPFTVWYMFANVLEKHSVFFVKELWYLSTKLHGVVTYFLSIFIPAHSVKMKYVTASAPLCLRDIDSTATLQNDGLFFLIGLAVYPAL